MRAVQLKLPTPRDDKYYKFWLSAINEIIDGLMVKYSLSNEHATDATLKALRELRKYRAMFRFKETTMNEGLLWYNNDKNSTLTTKIEQAADRYRQRVGGVPNLAYVNPDDFNGEEIDGIAIHPKSNILKNHVLVGVA